MATKRKHAGLQELADDFRGLEPNDPGVWPLAPRIAAFVALLVVTVAAVWYFDWRDQVDMLERRQAEEVKLRADWVNKKGIVHRKFIDRSTAHLGPHGPEPEADDELPDRTGKSDDDH